MGLIAPTLPTIGQPNSTEDADILNALSALVSLVNGNIDAANITDGSITAVELEDGTVTQTELAATLAALLGITSAGVTRRGKTNIATSESRTNVAYGLMPTPDRVSGIVLPTDGLICVAYQAIWQESVNNTARAAIFLGANQLKIADLTSAAPIPSEAIHGASIAGVDKPLSTWAGGLFGAQFGLGDAGSSTNYTADVTTGQAVGVDTLAAGSSQIGYGVCVIHAAAGTYDVSVQFKSTSGSVQAKNRKLWVWTLGF